MNVELEHGKSYVSVDGDLIAVKVTGAFNKEGMLQSIEELKSAIESFNQKKFKLLIDYTQAEGGNPDVFDKINECNIWLNSQNMVAKAVVINSSIHLAILESRTPARNLQKSKNFEDKGTAMNWLKTL